MEPMTIASANALTTISRTQPVFLSGEVWSAPGERTIGVVRVHLVLSEARRIAEGQPHKQAGAPT